MVLLLVMDVFDQLRFDRLADGKRAIAFLSTKLIWKVSFLVDPPAGIGFQRIGDLRD